MRRKSKQSVEELIRENKRQILSNREELDRIEEKLAVRIVQRNGARSLST